jgi:hypothetical protein
LLARKKITLRSIVAGVRVAAHRRSLLEYALTDSNQRPDERSMERIDAALARLGTEHDIRGSATWRRPGPGRRIPGRR